MRAEQLAKGNASLGSFRGGGYESRSGGEVLPGGSRGKNFETTRQPEHDANLYEVRREPRGTLFPGESNPPEAGEHGILSAALVSGSILSRV